MVDISNHDLDRQVIETYPYPLATIYDQMLNAQTAEERVNLSIQFFEDIIKSLALVIISDYIRPENNDIRNDKFTELLLMHFRAPTSMTNWIKILTVGVEAFRDYRNRIFAQELYTLFWNDSNGMLRLRKSTQDTLNELLRDRNQQKLSHNQPTEESDWEVKEKSIRANIYTLLEMVQFFPNYLFIKVEDYDTGILRYWKWRGLEIIQGYEEDIETKLNKNHFYAMKDKQNFLPLHPLIIPQEIIPEEIIGQNNFGIYQAVSRKEVSYRVLPQNADTKVRRLERAVRDIIKYQHERLSLDQHFDSKLSWEQITTFTRRANQFKANSAYQDFLQREDLRSLFVRREALQRHFDAFLSDSTKLFFVVLGKSGIGKSSFIAQKAHDFMQDANKNVLIYDGALFDDASATIEQHLREDMRYIGITDDDIALEDMIATISKARSNNQQQFILVIDAINESYSPATLLKELNGIAKFVERDGIKVIVTCRPQSWSDMIKHKRNRVILAKNHYYHAPKSTEVGVELGLFTAQEMQNAFDRYKEFYDIKTNYDDLPTITQRQLYDPLTLSIICKANTKKQIPKSFRASQIYKAYIDSLIDERNETHLTLGDLQFLKETLMPLYIPDDVREPKAIINALSTTILSSHRDERGITVWERIMSEDEVEGKRVNQVYLNLADAQILTIRGSGAEISLGFRYERFWEYFGGERLLSIIRQNRQHDVEILCRLAEASTDQAYLIGIIVTALIDYLQDKSESDRGAFLIELSKNDSMFSLLGDVLFVVGREKTLDMSNILQSFMESENEPDDRMHVERKLLALSLAANFDFPKILLQAAVDEDTTVKSLAIFSIHTYWLVQPEKAYQLLQELADSSFRIFGIPRKTQFEALLGVSLYLFLREFHNNVGDRLLVIWKPVIEKLLHYTPHSSGGIGSFFEPIKRIIRTQIIKLALNYLLRASDDVTEDNAFSVAQMDAYFQNEMGQEERRQHSRQIIRFFDRDSNIAEIEPVLYKVAGSKYLMVNWLVCIALDLHLKESANTVADLAEKLLVAAEQYDPVGPLYSYAPLWPLAMVTRPELHDEHATFLDRYGNLIYRVLDRTDGIFSTITGNIRMLHFTRLVHCEAKELQTPIVGRALDYFQNALDNRDFKTLEHLLDYDFNVAGHQDWAIDIALDGIEKLLNYGDSANDKDESLVALHNKCINLLSGLRLLHTDKIDEFLAQKDIEIEVVRKVLTTVPRVNVGDRWTTEALNFWEKAIIRSEGEFWQKIHWLFAEAPETDRFPQWVSLLLRLSVNEIYGDAVFPEIENAYQTFRVEHYKK